MPRQLKLQFTPFGEEALTEATRRQDRPVEDLITDALKYYLYEHSIGHIAARVPKFPDDDGKLHRRTVRPSLSHEEWGALELAAERQSLPLGEVASYAVLYYLARLDTGQVAHWIAERSLGDADPAGPSR